MTVAAAAVDTTSLEARICHRFGDRRLLQRALTHRSWCAEHEGAPSNERLEFLGDAVLALAVSHLLYDKSGELTEGEMSKARAAVVNKTALAAAGRDAGFGEALRLGRGEDRSGGRNNPSLVADAVEAVIGAAYLDGGIDAATVVVRSLIGKRLRAAARSPGGADFKTLLQEQAARMGLDAPLYDITASGPQHDVRFRASVVVGAFRGAGSGGTKKRAAQRAAEVACRAMSAQRSPRAQQRA